MKIDPEKCIACFRCEEVCQYDAIAYHLNEEGVMALFINDSCKKCGDCNLMSNSSANILASSREVNQEQRFQKNREG